MSKFYKGNKNNDKNVTKCESCLKNNNKIDENIEEFNKNFIETCCQESIVKSSDSKLNYLNISGCFLLTDLSLK